MARFCALITLLSLVAPTAGSLLEPLTNQEIDTCYASFASASTEDMTARTKWLAPSKDGTKPAVADETAYFYKNRLAFQPLLNSDTMIVGTLFTFTEQTLKMSVIFPPMYPKESTTAHVSITSNSTGFTDVRECLISPNIWHCGIRFDLLDQTQEYLYTVHYAPNALDASLLYNYSGIIPTQSNNPRIAAMSCFGYDDTAEKESLVSALKAQRPDLIVLQGDQTYFHTQLVYGFMQLVYALHEITRSTPVIVQLDDHDRALANIWGAGTQAENSGAGIPLARPVCFINLYQHYAMWHDPDPVSKDVLLNGVSIRYTSYVYGRLDIAVVESRKFKNYANGTSLLGSGQESWLRTWCHAHPERFKIVLVETPFAQVYTHDGPNLDALLNRTLPVLLQVGDQDHDTNAYPVPGYLRAMEILKGCSNLVLSGDQHVGLAVTHDDYGITECTSPAAVNSYFWRVNYNQTGASHVDPYGNQYTLHQVWNVDVAVSSNFTPLETVYASPDIRQSRADGFLMVTVNGIKAVCSAQSYRTAQTSIWNHTVSLVLPERLSSPPPSFVPSAVPPPTNGSTLNFQPNEMSLPKPILLSSPVTVPTLTINNSMKQLANVCKEKLQRASRRCWKLKLQGFERVYDRHCKSACGNCTTKQLAQLERRSNYATFQSACVQTLNSTRSRLSN
jgi:hypothetical protein